MSSWNVIYSEDCINIIISIIKNFTEGAKVDKSLVFTFCRSGSSGDLLTRSSDIK